MFSFFRNSKPKPKQGPTFKDFTKDHDSARKYNDAMEQSFVVVNLSVNTHYDEDWVIVSECVQQSVNVEPNGTITDRALC